SWCGRIWKHWTQVPVALLGLGGVAGIVYGAAIENYAASGMALAATIGLIIGFIAINRLTPKKDFEDNVEDYRTEINRLHDINGELSKRKEELGAALSEA